MVASLAHKGHDVSWVHYSAKNSQENNHVSPLGIGHESSTSENREFHYAHFVVIGGTRSCFYAAGDDKVYIMATRGFLLYLSLPHCI